MGRSPRGPALLAAGAACAAFALCVQRGRERLAAARERLLAAADAQPAAPLDPQALDALPAPVRRYLLRAVGDVRQPVRAARFRQRGELRSGAASRRWMAFAAEQLVVPPALGFVWDARVELVPALLHLRLRDALIDGRGSGAASLLGALPVAAGAGSKELDAGALHRYLAEAVWTPTALWPGTALGWSAIDERSALATVTSARARVSLEFRFDETTGDVMSVYTGARWQQVKGGFRATPWEGRFGASAPVASGLRVPASGTAGWIEDGVWQAVWRGEIAGVRHDFAPA